MSEIMATIQRVKVVRRRIPWAYIKYVYLIAQEQPAPVLDYTA